MEPGQPVNAERNTAHIAARFVNSTIILWSLNMGQRAVQLLTLVILARILVPADFGVVAIATIIILILEVMTNVQVNNALVRTRDLDDSHLATAFTLNLIRGVVMAVLLAFIAHPLATFMAAPKLENILYVLTIPTILNGLTNPYFTLYQRNLDFRKDSQRRALGAFAGSIASVIFALLFRSYWALVVGTVVQAFVVLGLSYWRVPGRPRWSFDHYHEMLSFGIWILLQNLFLQLALRIEIFFIGKVMNTETVGAYTIGNQLNSLATGDIVPTLARSMFPALAIINDDIDRVRRNYMHIQAAGLAIALPIGIGLALLAEPLIYLLFGRNWALAIPVVQFVAPVAALQTVGAGVEALAMALGRVKALAARSVVYMFVRTLLLLGGFYWNGLIGLLIGRTIAGLFQSFYGLSLAASLTSRSTFDPIKVSWRSFASAILMAAVALLLPSAPFESLSEPMLFLQLAWRGGLCGLIYVGTHTLLWIVAGRPDGAETRLSGQVMRLIKRRAAKA